YGLLKSVTTFAGRKSIYHYSDDRRLIRVDLPEITTAIAEEYTYTDFKGNRPRITYAYSDGSEPIGEDGVLHGKYSRLRLESFSLPDFLGMDVPQQGFEYDQLTGKVSAVLFPTSVNPEQETPTLTVRWDLEYPDQPDAPEESSRVVIKAPVDDDGERHIVEYGFDHGILVMKNEVLPVHDPETGETTEEEAETDIEYMDDGRLTSITLPDGSQRTNCYADSANIPFCEGLVAGDSPDPFRATLSNVLAEVGAAPADAQGNQKTIVTRAEYQADNLLNAITDGIGRHIELAVPTATAQEWTTFAEESVSSASTYDVYGRLELFESADQASASGVAASPPIVRLEYGEDAKDTEGAGLLTAIYRGEFDENSQGVGTWRKFFYDDADNLREIATSFGSRSVALYDEADRPIRTLNGGMASDGMGPGFRGVATNTCAGWVDGEGWPDSGALTEKAYDVAGHLVLERRCQDYVDEHGAIQARWIETRYKYNAREQIY
ncbi:MAG: hypothetical protein GY835_03685, partial [bacterium]|nr:hypothetical protein [bacterium]